ncbi:hypothetical protein AWC38_SpisGene8719 [Stylophora pistillata]|uniref:Uncharacterized protein n=1 Tax=Stylophora pistillata TaxID=50429 RepID=A0A2B4SDT0_STYPI|nr:hypothetical protein AWC38_SpisGene8719 [Stylophora pistillata]
MHFKIVRVSDSATLSEAKERILVAFYTHFMPGMFATRESVSQNPALNEMYSPSDKGDDKTRSPTPWSTLWSTWMEYP